MNKNYYKRLANRLTVEMDTRSPGLRLTVIGQLLEAGYTPAEAQFLETVQTLVNYIGEKRDEYTQAVLEIEDPEDDGPEQTDSNAYKILEQGPYL